MVGLDKYTTFSKVSTTTSDTLTIDENGIRLNVPYIAGNEHGRSVTAYTDQKIDFSQYSRLYIGFKGTCGNSSTNGTLDFGVTTNIPNNDDSYTNKFCSFNLRYDDSSVYASSGKQCFFACADISSVDVNGYLKIRLNMMYWYYNALIEEIRLE